MFDSIINPVVDHVSRHTTKYVAGAAASAAATVGYVYREEIVGGAKKLYKGLTNGKSTPRKTKRKIKAKVLPRRGTKVKRPTGTKKHIIVSSKPKTLAQAQRKMLAAELIAQREIDASKAQVAELKAGLKKVSPAERKLVQPLIKSMEQVIAAMEADMKGTTKELGIAPKKKAKVAQKKVAA